MLKIGQEVVREKKNKGKGNVRENWHFEEKSGKIEIIVTLI